MAQICLHLKIYILPFLLYDAPLEKHVSKYDSFISFFATLPFIILLLGADILIFYLTTKWEDLVKKNENFWFRYVPSIVRSLSLVIVAKIYDMIAVYSTYLENRKQEDIYEIVMGVKVFIFRLISDFTAVIYSAIVTRDIYRLKTMLYTHILIKYVSEIGSKFLYPLVWNYFFKKIYFKKVNSKTRLYPIKFDEKKYDINNIDNNMNEIKINDTKINNEKENNNKLKEPDALKINLNTINSQTSDRALKKETLDGKKYDEKRKSFGTIVLESDLDLPLETAYQAYSQRWLLELVFKQYKNTLEIDHTSVQSSHSVSGSNFINAIASTITCRMLNAAKEARVLDHSTFGDMLDDLREGQRLSDGFSVNEIPKIDDFRWSHTIKCHKELMEKLHLACSDKVSETETKDSSEKNSDNDG